MYVGPTLFIPCGCLVIQPVSFGFSSFAKRLPTRYSILNKGKSPTVPGPDCTEDARMSHWNCSRSKACVCRAYADVHCYETEQFHARACLFGKITLDLIGLRETNNTSHLSRRDSQSAQPWPQLPLHLPRDKVRRTTAWGTFQHHTEHQKPMIEWIRLTGPYRLHGNSPQVLNISSIRIFDKI